MKNIWKLLIFATFFLLSQQAYCFLHFEPGIGYNRGHRQAAKTQGIGLTTKLGVEFTSFFIVADVGYHNLQISSTPSSTATDMGLCFGGDFKTWRFWFTYLVAADVKTEGTTTTEYKGDGLKLGMSGRLSNKAYMNLEVRFIDFSELNGAPTTHIMDVALLSVSWKLL